MLCGLRGGWPFTPALAGSTPAVDRHLAEGAFTVCCFKEASLVLWAAWDAPGAHAICDPSMATRLTSAVFIRGVSCSGAGRVCDGGVKGRVHGRR